MQRSRGLQRCTQGFGMRSQSPAGENEGPLGRYGDAKTGQQPRLEVRLAAQECDDLRDDIHGPFSSAGFWIVPARGGSAGGVDEGAIFRRVIGRGTAKELREGKGRIARRLSVDGVAQAFKRWRSGSDWPGRRWRR